MRDGVPAAAARVQAQTLIENVHVFAKNYTESDRERAPSNHVLIFDEAQRAWNLEQNLNKFKRNYSEPEMLLQIMERHEDWACVVALVGGGQEINSGEAGLEEWGRALAGSGKPWAVYASPEVIEGGTSTAGRRLFDAGNDAITVSTSDLLHLRTSNRSLRADNLARWVNHVLAGEMKDASAMRISDRFPVSLTRDLATARKVLREQALGESRYGLVLRKQQDCAPRGLNQTPTFMAPTHGIIGILRRVKTCDRASRVRYLPRNSRFRDWSLIGLECVGVVTSSGMAWSGERGSSGRPAFPNGCTSRTR
jgi:hypothetical protein